MKKRAESLHSLGRVFLEVGNKARKDEKMTAKALKSGGIGVELIEYRGLSNGEEVWHVNLREEDGMKNMRILQDKTIEREWHCKVTIYTNIGM